MGNIFTEHRRWWKVAIVLCIAGGVVAQPLNEVFGLPSWNPFSEVFTFQTSATFVGAIDTYVTASTYNATTKVNSTSVFLLNMGSGDVILQGKGALSVDNPLTITVNWVVPKSFESNLSHASMSFHPDFALPYPVTNNFLGFPNNAELNLTREGPVDFPNGTLYGEKWTSQPRTVVFIEAGYLGAELTFWNATVSTGVPGKTQQANLQGIITNPNVILIGDAGATSTVRTNDWVVTLTFAIILFMVVDLGSENRDEVKGK
ncbi:MAG: hypothetical protein JRN28_04820, partial [Nitrososphaerota archaeon]|nr:hypothetical protein [Nitrososphaerota archaeon]